MDESKDWLKHSLIKLRCEEAHLYFTRYFFKQRHAIKFMVNWHHVVMCDLIDKILNLDDGENFVVNVPPGSSKTETFVINLIARGLALNARSRFLHLSGSDILASLNSATARDLVQSDAYQEFWPLKIADDSKSKKRWNVVIDGQPAGGVYATSLGGQITGFRAGHMAPGFQGAIIIDDPVKPEDAFSKSKLEAANRKLLTTVKSRRANPRTPIIVVMQRIAKNDPVDFIKGGSLGGKWTYIKVPAVIDEAYVKTLAPKYQKLIDRAESDIKGRFSYWPYKEPIAQLLAMERGDGQDQNGARISRHVFTGQYQQDPVVLGGNLIKGTYFFRYKVLPQIKYRKIWADTAQKTKERNDFSVFEEWGLGVDGRGYLLDMIRGKWEAPELKRRAVAFWAKCKARDIDKYGQLRKMMVEDKSSGTGLVQSLKNPDPGDGIRIVIPIEGIERHKDKLTRLMDALPYLEAQTCGVPEEAPFTNDFIAECEGFSADDSHDFDDQVDPMIDFVNFELSTGNILKKWEALGAGK